MEPYITKSHFKARQQISKLRLSDHNLEIERRVKRGGGGGIWQKITGTSASSNTVIVYTSTGDDLMILLIGWSHIST